MDSQDPISWVKNEFDYGKGNKDDKIYFCGNSLGLKHKSLDIIINKDYDNVIDRSLDSSKFKSETGFNPQSWEKLIQTMYMNNL